MIGVIEPARKDELVKSAASALEPSQNAAASLLQEFELNGSAGFLLDDDGSRSSRVRPRQAIVTNHRQLLGESPYRSPLAGRCSPLASRVVRIS
jgi:hypothetical protein